MLLQNRFKISAKIIPCLLAVAVLPFATAQATQQSIAANSIANDNADVFNKTVSLPQINAAKNSQNTLNLSTADNDDIGAAIEALSRQAQVKQDALARLASELEEKQKQAEQQQQAQAAAVARQRGILAALPVDGYRVTSNFGYRTIFGKSQFHKGIDLAAPTGSPVYATGSGVVTRAGWVSGYGKFVEIDHGNGLVSRYGHNSRLYVTAGDRVTTKQRIADVGCTGRCTGPHVHYEVLKNGQQTDPNIHLAMATQ